MLVLIVRGTHLKELVKTLGDRIRIPKATGKSLQMKRTARYRLSLPLRLVIPKKIKCITDKRMNKWQFYIPLAEM